MDWDLFEQIRSPTPPPAVPRPRRTRPVKSPTPAEAETETLVTSGVGEEPSPYTASIPVEMKSSFTCDFVEEPMPELIATNEIVSAARGTIVINGRVHRIIDDRPSQRSLDHLPPEVLEQIFRRLEGVDVANLALVSKRLYDVSLTECVWVELIEKEFGLEAETYRGVGISGRDFYRHILYPYGWSLGCWVRQVKHYGGLLKVVVENGMIVGKEVMPPENPNFDLDVSFKDVFCIKLDPKGGRATLLCLREQYNKDESAVKQRRRVYSSSREASSQRSSSEDTEEESENVDDWDLFEKINSDDLDLEGEKREEKERRKMEEELKKMEEEQKKAKPPHGLEIKYVKEPYFRKGSDRRESPYFHLECRCPQTHKQDFDEFRQEDNTFRFLAMTKYDTIRAHGGKFTYQRYEAAPDYVFDAPIQGGCGNVDISNSHPSTSAATAAAATAVNTAVDTAVDSPGFFPLKPGMFKGTYGGHGIEFISIEKKSPFQFEAVKLSGDPNVPFGKVSFSGDLRDFLFPSEEEQISIDKLKPMEPERQSDPSVYRTLQPYRTPPDCFIRSPFTLPEKCRARFKAECQVSEWGYSAPQFIKAHLIVFSQDLLALLILDIKSVVLFHRLTPESVGFLPAPTKIFRPLPVPEAAATDAGLYVDLPAPKPRRAVFRWPPPKFGEALGDVDT